MPDSEISVVKFVSVRTVDRVRVVTNHCPLLKPSTLWTFKGYPSTVSVAQMINLKQKVISLLIVSYNAVKKFNKKRSNRVL